MERIDYIKEIERFQVVLTALDSTHRLNGHYFTPVEIQDARRTARMLLQLVEVGTYDLRKTGG